MGRRYLAAAAAALATSLGGQAIAAEQAQGAVVEFEINACSLKLDSGGVYYQHFEVDEIGASNCNQVSIGDRLSITYEIQDGKNVVLEVRLSESYTIGVVQAIDARSLTLSTGNVFDISALAGGVGVRPGDEVTVRFTPAPNGANVASSVSMGRELPKAEF